MLYRPKYCCQCGEKIDRAEWRLLNSRRFCELCETNFKGVDYVPRAIVVVGLVLAIFGFKGIFWSGAAPTERRPPAATRSAEPRSLKPVADPTPAPPAPAPTQPAPPLQIVEQPAKQAASSETRSYFCGAITKKGTPCSRRVKDKGARCWQHAGRAE